MNFIAKTLYGLEEVLEKELMLIGASDIQVVNRAVRFKGDTGLLYRANYCLRTALSILVPVTEFRIRSKEDLYNGGAKVEWDRFMDTDNTFSIVPVINSPLFGHTGYAGLILKDSIADYFRKKTGRRPSVDTDAPLNEVLAAGILMLSGWNATESLTDPMCGSGTFPIEAGLIACNIPSGKFRKAYGFQRWKDFDEDLFIRIKSECDRKIKLSPVKICGSDISDDAIRQSKANVLKAGLSEIVSLKVSDFKDVKSSDDRGYVFLNPPYGQRILPEETDQLYGMIGTTLKHNFTGTTAWLITSNKESLKMIGLKPREKRTLFNGALECVLLKYEMYQGSRKQEKG
jgi:putative N6-adenine-specific DNA methylase